MFRAVVLIAAVVLAADQLTKYWAESALSGGQTITILGDLLQLRLLYNPGAAFSIGSAYTWIFAVFAAAAVVAVTVVAWRVTSRAWAVALGLVLGGAATHLLDRLFREPGFARGHVVDFIDYAGFFVGNVADIALVVGVGIVMLLNVRGVPLRATAGPGETRSDEQVSSSGA
ncbi:signal peptidase II [Micromonospora ureilytica]|uniref:Lipoprotein signal peptidase n=1 Tax=Micromonospora ureilytica TaxID=709868 RepID=A0A3N9XY16_9ACTN|nr:signal peptidase II [Micromonospora ureilytica]RQX18001.1 signal peptidase II [Micromonospora ureilytica]